MKTGVQWELVLPRRVPPQPSPEVNPGGDCAACVLAGILGVSVAEVYAERGDDPDYALTNRYGWVRNLYKWKRRDLVSHWLSEVPLWPSGFRDEILRPFGWPGHMMGLEWFNYVRMALHGGYYVAAWVDFRCGGPLGQGSDHVVLICGARVTLRPLPSMPQAGVYDEEVLVSCSASNPSGEWVNRTDFLRERGGYNVCPVRPAP